MVGLLVAVLKSFAAACSEGMSHYGRAGLRL